MPPVPNATEDVKKAAAAAAAPLRSAEEIALSRQLETFSIAEEEDPEEVVAAAEAGELKLPKTLKAVHQLMQEVLAAEPENSRAEKLKRAKLAVIRAHLFELEQGTPTPVLTMAHHRTITTAQSKHAIAFKLGELARSHPEVQTLLDERDALKKQVAELTAKKTE